MALALLMAGTRGQDLVNTEIFEQEVNEGLSLGNKQYAFYQMTISDMYFNGTQYLAVRLIQDAFDSDPDLFISKVNTQPTSTLNSEFYSVKKGSDTYVFKNSDINNGDVLFIGVGCINACQYTLATDYFPIINLAESATTQLRFDGHASNMFEYFIPQDASDGFTQAVTFTIVSEDPYNPISVYFSFNTNIYIEEPQRDNLIKNGVGYYFTNNDQNWCTICYVYFYIETTIPGRYYVRASASARNPVLPTSKESYLFTNQMQQDCFQYFVLSAQADLLLNLNLYEGDVNFYLTGQNIPSGPNDSNILMRAAKATQMQLIYSAADRAQIGLRTGLYEVCIFGNLDSSVAITPTENNTAGRYIAQDGVVYTFNVASITSDYFTYTSPFLNQPANITVRVEGFNINFTAGNWVPKIFYKVCPNNNFVNCFLNSAERQGLGGTMTPLNNTVIQGSTVRLGQIQHRPSMCGDPNNCFYLITVFNDQNTTVPIRTSLMVTSQLSASQSVTIDQSYQNVLLQGEYFYYQLQPGNTNAYGYLNQLTINIEAIIGDVDLVVSFTNPLPRIEGSDGISSRQTDNFEAITLVRADNFTLNRTIYIGVYATSMTVYSLTFEPVYSYSVQSLLSSAVPIIESSPVYITYTQEYEESFFSFNPWWADFEQRAIIFAADVIFNKVFFYAQANDFPQFYQDSAYSDIGDIIDIPYGAYQISDCFYLRSRPDFALYDLISSRQYIFNMISFSQPQTQAYAGDFIDLFSNESQYGFANGSQSYYRHYLIDMNATVNVTVETIIGEPVLLVTVSEQPSYPMSSDPSTYSERVESSDNMNDKVFRITPDWRYSQDMLCDQAGYMYDGGNQYCTVYIAVECLSACIYKITLQMEQRFNPALNVTNQTNSIARSRAVPIYLTSQNYYTGSVGFNQTKYFYYPITSSSADTVIYLNKTGPLMKNGDSRILLSVLRDGGNFNNFNSTYMYENWFYPNRTNYIIASQTNISTQPEFIDICPQTFNLMCGQNNSCVLVLGVQGLTPNMSSNFRMIAYQQSNKLYDRQPIRGNIQQVGNYQYYWFSSNASFDQPSLNWEHIISVSVDPGNPQNDVDLFVSVLDGRYPTSNDFDFKSDNLGPDMVSIKKTDPFWNNTGYLTQYGVVFVVGVKALTPNVNFTLMMTGPVRYQVSFTTLQLGNVVQKSFVGGSTNSQPDIYRWFNWGQRDFRISIAITSGTIQANMNTMNERGFTNNGYLAIPINANNSLWSANSTIPNILDFRVTKVDPVNYCYYCWYFLSITPSPLNSSASYRVSITPVADGGENVALLTANNPVNMILPATGTTIQYRFLLDNKQPFSVQAQVNSGSLNMYISLVPGGSQSFIWKSDSSQGNPVKINVKTSDVNFYVGAFYYIILQSSNGRVDFRLSLNQFKDALQIQSGISYKQEFYTAEERVKLYYFQAPQARQWLRANIRITAYTQNFYPTVLVTKNVLIQAPQNASQQLVFPNYQSNNFTFGDNFTSQIGQDQFNFTFRDFANSSQTYFTVAVYSWSYGLTDMRKHEFRISLQIDPLTSQAVSNIQQPYSFLSYLSIQGERLKSIYTQWMMDAKHYYDSLIDLHKSVE